MIRALLDDMIIQSKKGNDFDLKLWTELDYEEKKKFISDNIDGIYIEKIKGSIDTIFNNDKHICSMAAIEDQKYVEDYRFEVVIKDLM